MIAQSTADHIKIAAGITTRIPDRAANAMSEHIRNIELSTQRVLSGLEAPRSLARAQRMSRASAEVLDGRKPTAARRQTRS